MCKVPRPLTWRKNFLNLHLLLLDSVPKVSCGEVVLEVRPYLQPNLSEGTELQCRLLPRGELSIVNKIYLYITP